MKPPPPLPPALPPPHPDSPHPFSPFPEHWVRALDLGLDVNTGDIILYDGRLAVYKHSLDLIFYLIANQDENELMINTALSAFSDAVHMLLRNQVEKRAVLENLDLVLLCLDETIDEGCVTPTPISQLPKHRPSTRRPVFSLWPLRANVTLFHVPFTASSWKRIRRR